MLTAAATLDDFMALNDELAALVAADVPLDLGLVGARDNVGGELESINAAVARRVSRGDTLTQAIEDEQSLPSPYRCFIQMGLRSGQLDSALDGSQRMAETAAETRYGFRSALVYPLIVCLLAYAGLIALCLFLVPQLESAHQEMRVSVGTGLQILLALRHTMPYWIILVPVVIALLFVWARRSGAQGRSTKDRGPGMWARMTGRARATSLEQFAKFAEAMTSLLESQQPFAETLPLAACATNDPTLRRAAGEIAAAIGAGQPASSSVTSGRDLPPFLAWALLHSEPTIPRVRALHMAASVYRDSAQRHAERVRVIAPILTCIFIGGTVTLLYGLAVFAPVVDLLYKIGSSAPSR